MKDREDIIIQPEMLPGENEIPATGLLCLNPGDSARLGREILADGGRRQFLFNSNLYVSPVNAGSRPFFVAGPAVGAPMAVMTLEKLIALGCHRVLVWGCCGSLTKRLRIGDLFVPSSGFSDEGTSRHYPVAGGRPASHDWRRLLQEHLAAIGRVGLEGLVWSTDAPYRESRQKMAEYTTRGALAVEMEYTALATVAAFRQIELAAVLIVSDELWGEAWRPGFRSRQFKRKSCEVLAELLAWLRQTEN